MSKTQYPSVVYVVYHKPDGTGSTSYHLVFTDKEAAIGDAVENEVNVGVYRLHAINRPVVAKRFAEDA